MASRECGRTTSGVHMGMGTRLRWMRSSGARNPTQHGRGDSAYLMPRLAARGAPFMLDEWAV